MAVACLKSMANRLRSGSANLSTFASTANQMVQSPGGFKSKLPKGDLVPVCVAMGMVTLSATFGVYTALHQLGRAPNVSLKKSRRETIPEIVEPERTAEEAEKFVKHSFFRKVAHVKDSNHQELEPNPIRGDIFTRPLQVETLKDIGVDPKPNK
ncbi:hypothetical protein CASFOL_037983 [Castilleja foliolosa]|uniref:Uncharacterized protein n=1 Tax=Castilleja foliolosa TaxID=1961234 RepID=A0ABD3BK64_9LAMI